MKIVSIFYERVPEGKLCRHWWLARAYGDWTNFTRVMVIWPFHYAVQIVHWATWKWDKYRHKKSWMDTQIEAAVRQSETGDVRRFIRRATARLP